MMSVMAWLLFVYLFPLTFVALCVDYFTGFHPWICLLIVIIDLTLLDKWVNPKRDPESWMHTTNEPQPRNVVRKTNAFEKRMKEQHERLMAQQRADGPCVVCFGEDGELNTKEDDKRPGIVYRVHASCLRIEVDPCVYCSRRDGVLENVADPYRPGVLYKAHAACRASDVSDDSWSFFVVEMVTQMFFFPLSFGAFVVDSVQHVVGVSFSPLFIFVTESFLDVDFFSMLGALAAGVFLVHMIGFVWSASDTGTCSPIVCMDDPVVAELFARHNPGIVFIAPRTFVDMCPSVHS